MRFEPLVTVITVTYNSEKYVRDAIESVLQQTYRNIEYIIADDASTDNTWEIIRGYDDPKIKSYRNETNLREYKNRKKALSIAKGDYVIFIDGDDIIFPHGIETYVHYAGCYPEAGMLIQKGYFHNAVWPVLLTSKEVIRNAFSDPVNLLASSFASNFFKKSALESVGGISTEYKTGDEIIRLKIASRYPVAFIPGWLSWPRETPGQASASIPEDIQLFELAQRGKEITDFIAEVHHDHELILLVKGSVKMQIVSKIKSCVKHLKILRALRYKHKYNISFRNLIASSEVTTLNAGILNEFSSVKPLQQKSK